MARPLGANAGEGPPSAACVVICAAGPPPPPRTALREARRQDACGRSAPRLAQSPCKPCLFSRQGLRPEDRPEQRHLDTAQRSRPRGARAASAETRRSFCTEGAPGASRDVHTHAHTRTPHVHTSIYHTHTHIHTCVHVFTHAHIPHLCTHHSYVHVCAHSPCVYTYVTRVYAYIYTYTYAAQSDIYAHHMCIYVCVCVHVMHACTHTYTHVCVPCIHAMYIHTGRASSSMSHDLQPMPPVGQSLTSSRPMPVPSPCPARALLQGGLGDSRSPRHAQGVAPRPPRSPSPALLLLTNDCLSLSTERATQKPGRAI